MAIWILDTNVLLRGFYPGQPEHQQAFGAVNVLVDRGETLCANFQSLTEFWNVCTRPSTARGGFGLSTEETNQRLDTIEQHLSILDDTAGVRTEWRRLVVEHQVQGVRVYDARLVATMLAHGVSSLLSFDAADFRRYPLITAAHPQDVLDGRI
jgi:predicted nucleic acid-binding protein